MKFSFTNKIRAILILLFFITVIEGVVIFQIVSSADLSLQLTRNIQNTIVISTFIVFALSMLLFFYIPVFLQKVLKNIHTLIHEISLGNYKIDIDLNQYGEKMDKEFYQIIISLKDMLKYILRFDNLKKQKVLEQKNRIDAILEMSNDGFIVLNSRGEAVYLNRVITEHFPAIEPNINLMETNFHQDIESSIKKYGLELLKDKSKLEGRQFFIPALKRHIIIQSSMVKDLNGEVVGAVLCVGNLNINKKKVEKGKEQTEL